METPNSIGYKGGDQGIGLNPNGFDQGMVEPVSYYQVSDIKQALQTLQDADAEVVQADTDVGGGKLIESVKSCRLSGQLHRN